ncbi:MAG: 2-isopropylmalate synthase [bacterium]|jgi:2-isopropylmalate synthase
MRKVKIFDTTLRDGEQSPGVSLSTAEKLEIARQLAKLNVDIIEAGFPITSPGDFEAVTAIAKTIRGPIITGLCRANRTDIDRAWEALRYAAQPMIHIVLATSEIHMKYKLMKTPGEVVKMGAEAVAYAKQYCDLIEFSAEDASRSDPDFLVRVFKAVIAAGATTINVPDTVGYTTPVEFRKLISYIRANVPAGVTLSVHCHNDLGMATANSLAAVESGADQIECTINGIGERAGNTAMEEVVMAIKTRGDFYQCETGIVTEELYRTSRQVSTLTGMVVQPNKAVIGANAFSHEAGIHQDGVLKERTTYEIMKPEDVGLAGNRLVLGKHSGRHAFRARLAEFGYNLSQEDLNKAFELFKVMADKKKEITDRDIEAIVENEISFAPEIIALDYFQITSGNVTVPTATVKLSREGNAVEEAASGDGPVDAVYRAIDRALGIGHTELIEYGLKAVTEGKDALGEVAIKIRNGGNRVYVGRGVSTDVVEASAKAYINALNKLFGDKHAAQAAVAGGR